MAETAVVDPKTAPVAGEPTKETPPSAPWYEGFEDADVKGSKTLAKFTGTNDRELLGAVAKGYVNLEKMPRGVSVPKDGAPQAEWDTFYEKLGRPKTVDEYGIELQVPEGLQWNKEAEKHLLTKAHERGLTKTQAEGLLNDYLALANEGQIQIARDRAQNTEEAFGVIKQEWGGLTDQNLALVQRVVQEFGGEDFKVYLEETGLGNDARFLKFAYSMGRPMLEDGLVRGEGLGMKRTDAQAKIESLMKTEAWLKRDHPDHRATMQEINDLYPLAHGE
jgi:hypothetical protein